MISTVAATTANNKSNKKQTATIVVPSSLSSLSFAYAACRRQSKTNNKQQRKVLKHFLCLFPLHLCLSLLSLLTISLPVEARQELSHGEGKVVSLIFQKPFSIYVAAHSGDLQLCCRAEPRNNDVPGAVCLLGCEIAIMLIFCNYLPCNLPPPASEQPTSASASSSSLRSTVCSLSEKGLISFDAIAPSTCKCVFMLSSCRGRQLSAEGRQEEGR